MYDALLCFLERSFGGGLFPASLLEFSSLRIPWDLRHQERKIIHSFRFNVQGFFHALSLPTFRFSVQI